MSGVRLGLALAAAAVAMYFVQEGSRSTYEVGSGETPLAAAARAGELELVEQLLAQGADVNHHDSWMGRTPLHWAVSMESDQAYPKKNRLAIVQALLRTGADPNQVNTSTNAPLDEAVWNPDLVEALLKAGAPVEGGSRGRTPLGSAAYYSAGEMCFRATESMKRLAAAGANVNAQEPGSGWTPLLTAVMYGCPDMVEALLAAGADPNAETRLGETVLKAMERVEKVEAEQGSFLTKPSPVDRKRNVELVRKAGGHL